MFNGKMTIPRAKMPLTKDINCRTIAELARLAAEHRKMMLCLGRDQKIRLHYGAMFSTVEILTTLYFYWMNIDPKNPSWPLRDRFVLSKGHGAPSLYTTLAQAGYFDAKEFDRFRVLGSILQGHPDHNKTPGVDCTTGSLGQGFAVACAMALASKVDSAGFRAYTLISDGECNEGSIWEAAQIASNLKVDKITALLDRNKKSAFGPMAGRNDIEPIADKWRAFNWEVFECDGHDFESLTRALHAAEQVTGRPSMIICHTVKGKGIPHAERNNCKSNFALDEKYHQEAMVCLESILNGGTSHA